MPTKFFGPFSVLPEQISRLGASFTPFVNNLLEIEAAVASLAGSDLVTTYKENIGDGGVDAGLRRAVETRWLPAGESAWQFKAGNLDPAKCAAELAGAPGALDVLRRGGSYRLVLGAELNDKKLRSRRAALVDRALNLQLHCRDDAIEVLDANSLARWTESHLSLTVSPLLHGIDATVLDFDSWSRSNRHGTAWVASESRTRLADEIDTLVTGQVRLDLRIEGVSGLGKTRSVMEAIRGKLYQPLVVYIHAADSLAPNLIPQLLTQDRSALVVIDECSGKKHEGFAALLPRGARMRLLTIGEPDSYVPQVPFIGLAPLDSKTMEEILKRNQPNLWREAQRVVVEAAAGNVRYGLYLANAVVKQPRTTASEIITADTIRTYITRELPDGSIFLACSALALFARIGYDHELKFELEMLGASLGISTKELMSAARAMSELGLLSSQGRYRSVSPHPVAVYLAAIAWDEYSESIVKNLLPKLRPGAAERLFSRAAEIGGSDSAKGVVRHLLSSDGPFASLAAIAESGSSELLAQLAIVAPDEVAEVLTGVISSSTLSELRAESASRRGLVWALSKLAWHSKTFEVAADSLLRLAQAENETWSNNATGTWVELFGLWLPGTAARPAARMVYLQERVPNPDVTVRGLLVKAAHRALSAHESIVLSGELQGGVVVEPRGDPEVWGEAFDYQKGAISLLHLLAGDLDSEVAVAAVACLVNAIHPFLDANESVRDHLFRILASLSGDGLLQVQVEVSHLEALFRRVSNVDVASRQAGLDVLKAALPMAPPEDEISSLARMSRWELEDGELERRLLEHSKQLPDEGATDRILGILQSDIKSAFELGRVLAEIRPGPDVVTELVALAQTHNSDALIGYLWKLVDSGNTDAFDEVLDGPLARELPVVQLLTLTGRGPTSDAAWRRVNSLSENLPAGDVVSGLFGWRLQMDDDQLGRMLESLLPRIKTQRDYNAVIDFMALAVFRRDSSVNALDDRITDLVGLRLMFPETGQQSWDWTLLANRSLLTRPLDLLGTLIALLEGGSGHHFGREEEESLFREAFRRTGSDGWLLFANELVANAWRLRINLRGWPADVFDAEQVIAWIGNDLERARSMAEIVSVDAPVPDPIVRHLLAEFGGDQTVSSNLSGSFISGGWVGNESDRLTGMIARLEGWVSLNSEPQGVKLWARIMIADLKRHRVAALQREAERG